MRLHQSIYKRLFGNRPLSQQFTLSIAAILLIGIALSGVVLVETVQYQVQREITTQANLLMANLNAVRDYTSQSIKPKLIDQSPQQPDFVRETVPAYAARKVFEHFRQSPGHNFFRYKEAALNPTNPRDQADTFEQKLIEQFRQHPQQHEISGYRTLNHQSMFYIARPLAVNHTSCLQCHGKIAEAPPSLRKTYVTGGGFNWKLHDIVATQTLYVPAEGLHAQMFNRLQILCAVFSAVLAISILVINRLLRRQVIQPIQYLASLARQIRDRGSAYDLSANTSQLEQLSTQHSETGQLARAMLQMLQEIQARESALLESKATVEAESERRQILLEEHIRLCQKTEKARSDLKATEF